MLTAVNYFTEFYKLANAMVNRRGMKGKVGGWVNRGRRLPLYII